MAILIAFSLFLLLTAAITYYGHRVYAKPGRVQERLGGTVALDAMSGEVAGEPDQGPLLRIIQRVGQKVPMSPTDATLARRYLIAAGFRSETALSVYYGCKLIACAGLLLTALAVRDLVTSSMLFRTVILVAAGVVGWFGPGFILERMVSKRQETLRFSLPDALDLMVVCAEAGLGLDQSFVNVSRDLKITHPEICEELGLVNLEMRAGKRRADALRNLAERTGEPEIQKLVAVLIQADRFGTSISESLRTHSDFMRIRRRQEAEERAGKVGAKLVFPIFFFILPSMLIVTAGPGLLQVLKVLFPLMREFTLNAK